MNEQTKRILTWGGFIVGVIALLFVLASLGGSTPSTSTGTTNGTSLSQSADTASEMVKGNLNASVILVEYSDFQCPACAGYAPVLDQLVDDYGDDVAVVYRHFPLRSIHPQAQLAAQASYAASEQGKFWEYHDSLFNTQSTWSGSRNAEDHFMSLAESLSLDMERFESDMNSSAARQAVNDDYNSGTQSGVRGTPSLFLNGNQIQLPRNYAALTSLVEAELQ